jgi:hypothetical protein
MKPLQKLEKTMHTDRAGGHNMTFWRACARLYHLLGPGNAVMFTDWAPLSRGY